MEGFMLTVNGLLLLLVVANVAMFPTETVPLITVTSGELQVIVISRFVTGSSQLVIKPVIESVSFAANALSLLSVIAISVIRTDFAFSVKARKRFTRPLPS